MYIFRLIAQYFEENYFSSSLNANYDNLNFTGTATTLFMLVSGICLGIWLASFVIVFEKRVVGRFVRSLLEKGAKDKDSALSLSDLGMEKKGFIKRELSRASVSRKLISVVRADGSVTSFEDELATVFPELAKGISKNETDAENAEIGETDVIPEADIEEGQPVKKSAGKKAKDFFFPKNFRLAPLDFSTARFFIPEECRYRAELRFHEKGSSPWWLLLATVSVIVLFFLCLRFIPAIVGILDVSISNIKGY